MSSSAAVHRLKEIAGLFLRIGVFGFGGPAAHIAFMQLEIVEKRKWMDADHFMDLIGATSLIPGPNSTEMTMHCGYHRAGPKGLLTAGLAFILPAVLLTAFVAYIYEMYRYLPAVSPVLQGLQTIVIPLILFAGLKLGKKALSKFNLIALALLSLLLFIMGMPLIYILLIAGAFSWLGGQIGQRPKQFSSLILLPRLIAESSETISKAKLFLVFLKIGAILYGSGYVLFAFLDDALVDPGYMSAEQLLDAVAVGQLTPGPVLSTATFIGWQLGGVWGAVLATLGIFLPSFVLVYFLTPFLPRLQSNTHFRAVLNGVNAAAVALIVGVGVQMTVEVVVNWRGLLILAVGLMYLFGFKGKNAVALLLAGACLGYLLYA